MQVGNLSYHFPHKEDLVQELLESLLLGYAEMAAEALQGTANKP